ncbi:putative uncharacterized protein DDB_G0282133 isoform X2 [Daktulosphaira vitifoliae]|uniref:putative uncharacterized protein DDB_G0282133 isoform X2 n=1 Tax=Daktulosphaira vitifoliae TaxID=58002 RepID=UPI0021AAE122|nr:putative uncharacterized protein DDB_G0282133 isoform X2 [Daktulosphaira vitifoliae]
MIRLIVFLVFLTSATATGNHIKLHCTFSKYILNFFQLNEKYYNLSSKLSGDLNYSMEQLKYYGKNLKSQQVIVLSMIDELRKKSTPEFPADLMTVNLYLNNVMGHIYMFLDVKNSDGITLATDEERLRKGYEMNYNIIINQLIKYQDETCKHSSLYFIQLESHFYNLLNVSTECNNIPKIYDVEIAYKCLVDMKNNANNIFKKTIERNTYTDFHPKNMLFFYLFNSFSKYNKDITVFDDGLSFMRQTKIISDSDNELNTIELYENILLNFDGNNLKSFQQKILAASLQPLFSVMTLYFNIYLIIYSSSYMNVFLDSLIKMASSLVQIIWKLRHQNLYSFKVNKFLSDMGHDLNGLNWHSFNRLKYISNIKSLIANAMATNKIRLNEMNKTNRRNINTDDIHALIISTADEIQSVDKYVDALINKSKVFLIIKRSVDHNDMFEKPPIDTLNTNLMGRLVHYDEMSLFSSKKTKLVNINATDENKDIKTYIKGFDNNQNEQNVSLNNANKTFINGKVHQNYSKHESPIRVNKVYHEVDIKKNTTSYNNNNYKKHENVLISSDENQPNINSQQILQNENENYRKKILSNEKHIKKQKKKEKVFKPSSSSFSDENHSHFNYKDVEKDNKKNKPTYKKKDNISSSLSSAYSEEYRKHKTYDLDEPHIRSKLKHNRLNGVYRIEKLMKNYHKRDNSNNKYKHSPYSLSSSFENHHSRKLSELDHTSSNYKTQGNFLNGVYRIEKLKEGKHKSNGYNKKVNDSSYTYFGDKKSKRICNLDKNYTKHKLKYYNLNESDNGKYNTKYKQIKKMEKNKSKESLGSSDEDPSHEHSGLNEKYLKNKSKTRNSNEIVHGKYLDKDKQKNKVKVYKSKELSGCSDENPPHKHSSLEEKYSKNKSKTHNSNENDHEKYFDKDKQKIKVKVYKSKELSGCSDGNPPHKHSSLEEKYSKNKSKTHNSNENDHEKYFDKDKQKNKVKVYKSKELSGCSDEDPSYKHTHKYIQYKDFEKDKLKNKVKVNKSKQSSGSSDEHPPHKYLNKNFNHESKKDFRSYQNKRNSFEINSILNQNDYQPVKYNAEPLNNSKLVNKKMNSSKFNELKTDIENQISMNNKPSPIDNKQENLFRKKNQYGSEEKKYHHSDENTDAPPQYSTFKKDDSRFIKYDKHRQTASDEELILWNGTIKYIDEDATSLHCLFSNYILRFIQLNEERFIANHYQDNTHGQFSLDSLIYYNSNLQSQSEYILIMLDELRRRKYNIYPTDLMTVNLYLNNLKGNLNIKSLENDNNKSINKNTLKYIRKNFVKNYNIMIEHLSNFVESKCQSCSQTFINEQFKELKRVVDDINRKNTKNNKRRLLEDLQMLKFSGFTAFKKSLDNDSNFDFHPSNMLFYELMTDSSIVDPSFNISDRSNRISENKNMLNLMRETIVNTNRNSSIKNSIFEAFDCVVLNFNANFVKSFQQQVLAATILPFFKTISNYLVAFKQIIIIDNRSTKYADVLSKIGILLKSHFKNFLNLNLFSKKPTQYLFVVQNRFDEILNFEINSSTSSRYFDLISNLLSMCSKPMQINQLEFSINIQIPNRITEDWYYSTIIDINNEVNNLKYFTASLLPYKNVYKTIRRSVSHENLFETKPLDIIENCVLDFNYDDEDINEE